MSATQADLPRDAEIVANLWYLLDGQGFIHSLRVALYVASGSESEKLDFLFSRAYLDYLVARTFPVPYRYATAFVDAQDGSDDQYAVIHHDSVSSVGGIEQLFFDALDLLQSEFPMQTQLEVPESPLTKVTALIGLVNGEVVPVDALR